MTDRTRLRCCFIFCAATALASVSWAADWPQWRGPSHSDITSESSGWPGGWPPKKLWSRNVGKGCTSPIIVEGKLYVMGWTPGGPRGGVDTLYCFNARTGRELWKQPYPCPRYGRFATGDEGEYGGPTSTPAFDKAAGLLFTLSTDGDLRCWDATQQGKPLWSKNLYDEYKVPRRPFVGGGLRDYGYTAAPLVRDDLVIAEAGAPEGTVMAFDKKTGQRRWASQYKGPAGHTGGLVPMKVAGKDCLAVLTTHDLVVMRLDNGHEGETVATTKWETHFICNIATPAAVDDRVVVTSCHSHKESKLFEAQLGSLRARWTSGRYACASSPVIYRDRVFVINDALQCLDLATGALKWRGGAFGHGSCLVTTADSKLIAFGARKLVLLDPLADGYSELSRLDGVASATCYPHVTLSDGVLACKDRDGNLVCFSVRSVPSPPDTTPPGLVWAAATAPTKAVLHFSEPVDEGSAEDPGNYAVSDGVKILAAALGENQDSVTLTASTLEEGATYTLTVSGIRDCAKPANTMAKAAQAAIRFVPTRRVAQGLVALYTFEEGKGAAVSDVSGVGKPLNLRLEDETAAKWVPGGLAIPSPAAIESAGPAAKIVEACRKSSEITVEAWIKPANASQGGPSRIVSLSQDPYKRDFTLGQDGASFDVRLRTTRTGENGMNPSLTSQGGVATELSHVVYTRDASGKATIRVNGAVQGSGTIPGDLSNWDEGFRLALANELTHDRPWLGELHLVAIYSRALTAPEVETNHRAGPEGKTPRE
jgi:outer membrane protein assembly factor BamB